MKLLSLFMLFFLHQTAANHHGLRENPKLYASIASEIPESSFDSIRHGGVFIRTVALLAKGDTLNGSIQMERGWDEGDFSKSMLCRRVRIEDDRTGKSKIYGPDRLKWFKLYLGNGRVETFYSSVRNGLVPVKQRETDGLWNLGYGVFLHYIKGNRLKEFKEYYWTYNRQIFVSAYEASIYLVKNDKEIFSFTHRHLTKKDEAEWQDKMLTFISDCSSLANFFSKYPDVLSVKDLVDRYDSCSQAK